MPTISTDVLECYLNCQFKAHLKLRGENGVKSDYETMLLAARTELKRMAIEKLLASQPAARIPTEIPVALAALMEGHPLILSATLADNIFSLKYDGLKRVDGASKLGHFHYVPILFHEGHTVRTEQHRVLEVYGLLLSQIQGRQPERGILLHGPTCRSSSIRLDLDLRTTGRLLRGLKDLADPSESPPPLVLNDHCQICEFQQRCHAQAIQEDNLSLIRGMREKEVHNCAKKGIFTVTQLAHTFRPRRRGKRATPQTNHRYPALQALAIRDNRVYVFGTPQLPESPVRVYLDLEGKPDERFDYLLGCLIVADGTQRTLSSWADDRGQEPQMFDRLLEVLEPYESFTVFSYGSYEASFLKRMARRAEYVESAQHVLNSLVNVLSTVYSHVYFPTFSNGLKGRGGVLGMHMECPRCIRCAESRMALAVGAYTRRGMEGQAAHLQPRRLRSS
jgi:predicted RecB family nuclease